MVIRGCWDREQQIFYPLEEKGLSISAVAPHVQFTHLLGCKNVSLLSGALKNPRLSNSQESEGPAPSDSNQLLILGAICTVGIFFAGKSHWGGQWWGENTVIGFFYQFLSPPNSLCGYDMSTDLWCPHEVFSPSGCFSQYRKFYSSAPDDFPQSILSNPEKK